MEKVRAELAMFFVKKARALHLTSFLSSVLLKTIATSQSARGNLDSYCKIKHLLPVEVRFLSCKQHKVSNLVL